MPAPHSSSHPPFRRPPATGTTRSRAVHRLAATRSTGAPATVWAPPPAAVDDRWRAWVFTAIDRAFLPPRGHRIDLTEHLVTHPHPGPTGHHSDHDRTEGLACSSVVVPYWAALIGDEPAAAALTASPTPTPNPVPVVNPVGPVPPVIDGADVLADLAVVDLDGAEADDRLGMFAARVLRGGGVLAVLTHCNHTLTGNSDGDGVGGAEGAVAGLVDPTGAVVASAQNADLLYLQHIVIPTRPLVGAAGVTGTPGAAIDVDAVDRFPSRHPIGHVDLLMFSRSGRDQSGPPGSDPPPHWSDLTPIVEPHPVNSGVLAGRRSS